jgi:EAL domain-containing protein (putative c-di-GMP-specific phosphodiesterase class I)/GGDEF domain-containing protein
MQEMEPTMYSAEDYVDPLAMAAQAAPSLLRDPLTGMHNKHGFIALGNKALPRMLARGERPRVIYMELRNYEGLLARLDYPQVMELLNAVRERLESVFGAEALLARFDSERFAALVDYRDPDLSQMKAALETPVRIASLSLRLDITLGVAGYPDGADNMDMLVIAARTARQEAVNAGRSIGFFAHDLRQQLARRRAIEDALWTCGDGSGLSVVYQPKIRIRDGHMSGVEALMRWDHPELGRLSPSEFIPIAERTRTIGIIGEWLTREALRQTRRWRDQGLDLRMAINVSPVQLSPALDEDLHSLGMLDILCDEADRLGLDRSRVEVEITEGMLTDDSAMAVIKSLAGAGFSIAIDDFGRDHSALSLLVNSPARTLKIDRSFVTGVRNNERQMAVVRFIVQLARQLGMSTVVEGVENIHELVALADVGCDYCQGFFYYRPLAAEQITALRHRQ